MSKSRKSWKRRKIMEEMGLQLNQLKTWFVQACAAKPKWQWVQCKLFYIIRKRRGEMGMGACKECIADMLKENKKVQIFIRTQALMFFRWIMPKQEWWDFWWRRRCWLCKSICVHIQQRMDDKCQLFWGQCWWPFLDILFTSIHTHPLSPFWWYKTICIAHIAIKAWPCMTKQTRPWADLIEAPSLPWFSAFQHQLDLDTHSSQTNVEHPFVKRMQKWGEPEHGAMTASLFRNCNWEHCQWLFCWRDAEARQAWAWGNHSRR